jgi:alpha-L-rhamnosidase
LKITADDNYRLYVNGTLIDETPRLWSSPQTYTVTLFRNPTRKNVLAVEGINTAEISGLDRGIIADLSFDAGGGAQSVLTDTTWKLSTTLVTDWFTVAFNDAAWVAATDEGAHGIVPYNMVLGTSSARWIWAYDASGDASTKTDPPESVWVRKSFYVNLAGAVTSTPNACP